jgi:hypothetical protein
MKSSKNINTFESSYTMKIPFITNRDNFRLDRIIDDYQSRIIKIARNIIPERKDKKDKNKKNDDLIQEKVVPKKKILSIVEKKVLRINDGVLDNLLEKSDDKDYKKMIERLTIGDTKFMKNIPQLRSKEGISLNEKLISKDLQKSILNIKSVEKNKNITEERSKGSKLIMPDINQNNNSLLNNYKSDKNTFFLTGSSSVNNINIDVNTSNTGKGKIFNSTEKEKEKLKKSSKKLMKKYYNDLKIKIKNEDEDEEDSDFISEDEKYLNTQINRTKFENEFYKRSKEIEAKLLRSTDKKKNFYTNKNDNFFSQANYEMINTLNSVKNIDYLDMLRNKNDFFKNKKQRQTLQCLDEKKPVRQEKVFDKKNYTSTMKNFISAVNTEVEKYRNTFSDIERGVKNYDHIQSVRANISPGKIKDKKMMYTDKFVRKYFIYGNSGGQFISEDKENDDIIERSDNLAKIRPEISFKFRKIIMDKFTDVEHNVFKSTEIQKLQFQKNNKIVKSMVEDTEKLKSRVENDLVRFLSKINS